MTFGRKVLVIDGDPASSEVLAYSLKSLGYMVAIAPDGERAVNMAYDKEVELVIVDMYTPRHDGHTVVRMLREKHPRRIFKVVAVTRDESAEVREDMDRLGTDGLLVKPIDLDLLREMMGRLVPGQARREGLLYRRVRERGAGRRPESRPFDPRAGLLRRET